MTVHELRAILEHCPPDATIALDCAGAAYEPIDACLWITPNRLSVMLLTDDKVSCSNERYEVLYRRPIPQGAD